MTADLIGVSNLVAALATLVMAAVVYLELWRLRLGFPPVAALLTTYFLVLAVDRLAAPDPLLGYSTVLDAATDIALILVLAMLLQHARRLARALFSTIDEARWRAEEYERARHDYSQLVSHRLANPLAAIIGAAHTLQRSDIPDSSRQPLVATILEAAHRTEQLGLGPERLGAEEHELDAVPRRRPTGRRP